VETEEYLDEPKTAFDRIARDALKKPNNRPKNLDFIDSLIQKVKDKNFQLTDGQFLDFIHDFKIALNISVNTLADLTRCDIPTLELWLAKRATPHSVIQQAVIHELHDTLVMERRTRQSSKALAPSL